MMARSSNDVDVDGGHSDGAELIAGLELMADVEEDQSSSLALDQGRTMSGDQSASLVLAQKSSSHGRERRFGDQSSSLVLHQGQGTNGSQSASLILSERSSSHG